MIEVTQLSFTYPGAARPALRDVSFNLPAGSFTLVAGPSGSGKSTLLRLFNGLVPHFSGGTLRGQVRVGGLDPVAQGPQRMSALVGFVQQDPESQFITGYVEDEIAFGLENAGWLRAAIAARVTELLERLHLAHLRGRRLDTLSGGEQQRVLIASVLAPRPRVLVLDEPTSQLDPAGAQEVLALIAQLRAQGLTLVVAEHRLERLLPFADFILGMEEGGLLQLGTPSALPPGLAGLLWTGGAAVPLSPGRLLAEGIRSLPAGLALPGDGCAVSSGLASAGGERDATAGEVLLAAERLTVRYGACTALDEVSLTLHAGELLVLVGPNGAGKSTLLRTLVGLQKSDAGRIWLAGRPLGTDVAQIARQVAYLPQDPNALLFAERARDELTLTLRNHRLAPSPLDPEQLLEQLGLLPYAEAYPRDLSTGQRQRLALAALLITRPRVLLLDEPTRGLDLPAKRALLELVHPWREQGAGILIATHDLPLFTAAADRVLVLERGRMVSANGRE